MPATSGAIRAGRAYVQLFCDSIGLTKGLQDAERRFRAFGMTIGKWGAAIASMGAAMFAPLMAGVKVFSDLGDSIAKMAQRTGFSTEAISRLRFAADMSGTSIETLEGAIRKMQAGIDRGNPGLESLGMNLEALRELSPEQQFLTIAEALSRIEDPTQKASLAMQIFGRSGAELIPLLNEGRAGMARLGAECDRLGMTLSGKDARAAEELNDALGKVWGTMKGVTLMVGAALAPAVTRASEHFATFVSDVIEVINNNRDLVTTFAKAAAAAVALGTGMVILAGLFIGGAAACQGMLMFIGLLNGAFLLLVNPMTWVIGAIVALAHHIGALEAPLEMAGSAFSKFGERGLEAWEGIVNAVKAGDLELAFEVATTFMESEWLRLLDTMTHKWNQFTRLVQSPFSVEAGVEFAFGMAGRLAGDKFGINPFNAGETSYSTDLRDAERRHADANRRAGLKAADLELGQMPTLSNVLLQRANKPDTETSPTTRPHTDRGVFDDYELPELDSRIRSLRKGADTVQLADANAHARTQSGTFSTLASQMFANVVRDDVQKQIKDGIDKVAENTARIARKEMAFGV